jgi:hypothetical protein
MQKNTCLWVVLILVFAIALSLQQDTESTNTPATNDPILEAGVNDQTEKPIETQPEIPSETQTEPQTETQPESVPELQEEPINEADYEPARLKTLKAAQLRAMLEEKGIDPTGYSQKSDIIDKIIETKNLPRVRREPPQSAAGGAQPHEMSYDEIRRMMENRNGGVNDDVLEKLRQAGFDTSNLRNNGQDDFWARAAELKRQNEQKKKDEL